MGSERREIAPEQKTSAHHSTEVAKKVRGLVKEFIQEAHRAAAEGKPVAWVMAQHINPIYMAMDVVPFLTENWAGLCATKRMADPYIVRAESEGYANVICSYARIGLGFASMMREGVVPADAPDGGMPHPTMLIGRAFACDGGFKWYQSLARYLDVPFYAPDFVLPPRAGAFREDTKKRYIKYQVEQYRALVEFVEKITGRRMDWERLRLYVDTAIETWQVWNACGEFYKAVPTPIGQEDAFNFYAIGAMHEGETRALDFFNDVYAELSSRVEKGIGIIPDEKYRLLWGGGLPPWHTMRIFNYFGERGAVFPAGPYYTDIGEIPDNVSDPLERLALRDYTIRLKSYDYGGLSAYGSLSSPDVLSRIESYHVDGVAFHWNKSCRATTIGHLYFRDMVERFSGVPCLMLESDMCDVRDYLEAEWKDKINAFLEMVEVNKQTGLR